MKKEVLVSISGLQYEIDNEEEVEVISSGEYYNQDGKHYINFDEILDINAEDITHCTLILTENQIDCMKRGASNVHMVFEKDKKNTTIYNTQFGDIQVGIYTTDIRLVEEDDKITVDIKYGLDINYAFISECQIQIKINAKRKN